MLQRIFIFSFLVIFCKSAHASPLTSPAKNSNPECSHSEVLILGAGMAGISAGHTLTQQGVDDFKIIEYQDRIGGRTLHQKFGRKPDGSQYTVELGTNWITGLHGTKVSNIPQGVVNPVWTLAQEVNLTTVPDGERQLCYDHNGPSDWCRLWSVFAEADARMRVDANRRVRNGKGDISVRAALRLVGWDSTNNLYKQAMEWLVWDADGAAPLDLSSHIFGELSVDASIGPTERFVLDQRGYDLVTKHLARKYLKPGDDRLVFSRPVTNIVHTGNGVTVRTANDTCYTADYAICTFSLGVLQQAVNGRAPVTFTPALPAWKEESITTNVMGIYTKIFYQFDRAFWPKDVQYFYYASPTTRGYWTLWESLDFPGSPLEGSGIIFGTVVWDQSMRIEQLPDEQTMQEGIRVLRQMFPKAVIPDKPLDFLYPRWGMTPWAFGSYSNWALGYSLEQFVNFRANLHKLWFAGEATSAEYWGYLHGAFYEGDFAGREVAACVKNMTTCADRNRYPDIPGDPIWKYSHENGFQDPIGILVDESGTI